MNREYNAIPKLGTGRTSFQVGMRSRLYSGLDHLLLVQSTGYTEEYRRVFFRDIRYVVACETRRSVWVTVSLAAILLILSLLHTFYVPWGFIACFSLPFAIALVVNLVRGRTCVCRVGTEVQVMLLPTPQRMNKVPILMEFLKTQIPAPDGGSETP